MGARFRTNGSQPVRLIDAILSTVISAPSRLPDLVADALFARSCIVCGTAVGQDSALDLCPACSAAAVLCGPYVCERCGAPDDAGDSCLCACSPEPVFDRARSAFVWAGPIRNLVLGLKYSRRWDLAARMSALMAATWRMADLPRPDLVTCVPLSPKRYLGRGYNQAGLLATGFSRAIGVACDQSLLLRTRFSSSTKNAGPDERRRIVSGAFKANRRRAVDGLHVILVDDVLTTGATASECAAVLKAAGARTIDVVTFARAVKHV